MYGQFRFTIDLSETIGELARMLGIMRGRPFPYEEALKACAQYKQLSLVCACAFMMSNLGRSLQEEKLNPTKLRNMLMEEVKRSYPAFATEQDEWWGYDSVIATITEMGVSLLMDISISLPQLKTAFGLPHLFVFVPSHVEEVGSFMTFVLHSRPAPYNKLLASASYEDKPTGS